MIKIIQLDSCSGLGGGQRITFEIVKALRAQFRFIIIVPFGRFLKRYSELGFLFQGLKKGSLLDTVKQVRKVIQKVSPDIIHTHGTRAAFWARLAVLRLKNKPKIIYTLHGFHIVRRGFFLRWPLIFAERFLNRWTDILVCVSEADKDLVLKYKTIDPQKIRLIRNGIGIERFQLASDITEQAKEALGLKNKLVLCSIGRLHRPKDFSTILKALKIVVFQLKDVRLLIIGDGPLREELEKETRDLGLNEYVRFLGWREDVPTLLNLSDMVILSTRWEGLPLVPLEAGACQRPVIASDVDGVRETVIDKKTGLLFKPGSGKDLAEKILELVESEERGTKLGQRAFKFISQNFSKQKMVKEYQDLYHSLL